MLSKAISLLQRTAHKGNHFNKESETEICEVVQVTAHQYQEVTSFYRMTVEIVKAQRCERHDTVRKC